MEKAAINIPSWVGSKIVIGRQEGYQQEQGVVLN